MKSFIPELGVYVAIGLAGATMFLAVNIYALATTSHMIVASW